MVVLNVAHTVEAVVADLLLLVQLEQIVLVVMVEQELHLL
jgi:hypothetical protein